MPKPSAAPSFDRGNTHLVQRRAEALDALDSVLPFDRREVLAELLTDEDVETLRHLAKARHRRELPARARFRPRLSRSLVGCRHRKTAALAGAGGTADQVRGASSVGPGQARDRPCARHAARGDRDFAGARPVARRRAARAEHRPPAAVELVDADRLAGFGRTVQRAGPAQRCQAGGAGQRPAARQKEQEGRDRRHSRRRAQGLWRRSPGRRP